MAERDTKGGDAGAKSNLATRGGETDAPQGGDEGSRAFDVRDTSGRWGRGASARAAAAGAVRSRPGPGRP
jgi:hypothetical protein